MGAVSGSIALCEHVEYHYSFIVYIGTEGSVHGALRVKQGCLASPLVAEMATTGS